MNVIANKYSLANIKLTPLQYAVFYLNSTNVKKKNNMQRNDKNIIKRKVTVKNY